MKRLAIGCAILASAMLSAQSAAEPADSLHGTWQQTDISKIELGFHGGVKCPRIWLERRSYSFEAEGDLAAGVYSEHLMSIPLGVMGSHPDCRFPPPAVDPLSFQDSS